MSTTTIRLRFSVGGVPMAPDGGAILRSPDGTYGVKRNDNNAVVVAEDTELLATDVVGTLAYTFTDPAPNLAYTAWIQATHGGVTYTQERQEEGGTTEVGVDAPLLVTLARARQHPTLSTISDDEVLTEYLAAAGQLIEEYCGRRHFARATRTERYDGPADRTLLLRTFPVEEVVAVVIADSYTGEDEEVELDSFELTPRTGELAYLQSGRRYFVAGIQNIGVTYTAGFSPVPPIVRMAVVNAAAWLRSSQLVDPAAASERLGNYAITMKSGGSTVAEGLPADIKAMVSTLKDWRV